MIRFFAFLCSAALTMQCSAQKPEMNLFCTLKLVEFRPTASMVETATTPVKIVGLYRQLEETQQLDVIQTLRLSAMENTEGMLRTETESFPKSAESPAVEAQSRKRRPSRTSPWRITH